MSEKYDPTAPDQHAQHLFDSADNPKALPALHAWLSGRNVDANVTPHAEIRRMLAEESERELAVPDGVRAATDAAKAWKEKD